MGAHKLYTLEASNHLGNVLTLFTDKKIPVGTGNTVSYYKADLVSSMDYSPFGAPLKGRTLYKGGANATTGLPNIATDGSRYGFNGQEKDNEISGAGNSMTAEFWQYDSRLGRRWNVDPLAEKFPDMSPYVFCNNNPIFYVDLDGLKPTPYPKALLGSADYYKWRVNDFLLQNPGKKASDAPDYYLNYGNKYIQRFTKETNNQLSKQGKQWLVNARRNLQVAIEDKLKVDPTIELRNGGKEFKEFAFKSHVNAYWDAGLSKLNTVDLVAIVLTPNFKDLTSEDGMKQAIDMMGYLTEYWLNNPMEGLKRGGELLANQDKIKAMVTEKALKEGVDPDKAMPILDRIIEKIPTIKTD